MTLKGIRKINLAEFFTATLFQNNRGTKCGSLATHLAHSHYDVATGEFFASFTCMSDDAVPKIMYVVYKIPNAGHALRAEPESPEDVWSRGIIIGEVEGKHNNPVHLDLEQESARIYIS